MDGAVGKASENAGAAHLQVPVGRDAYRSAAVHRGNVQYCRVARHVGATQIQVRAPEDAGDLAAFEILVGHHPAAAAEDGIFVHHGAAVQVVPESVMLPWFVALPRFELIAPASPPPGIRRDRKSTRLNS